MKDARLLIVDDHYSNVEMALSFLKGYTKEVYYAPNGKVACELAQKKTVDLIIMDWQMPEMDGIEAIRFLRQQEETKEIPVIMATGVMTTDENLKEAFEEGVVDFMKKPFSQIEFMTRIGAVLRMKNQHETIKQMLIQEKDYMSQLLDLKQRELTSMAVFDFQKTALLEQLLDQLGRLDRITNYVHATDIKSIEKELKSHIDLNRSWDSFKLHFDEMHTGFFERLDKQYPGLTINERKLSAYIKMGMGNFEICQMTGTADATLRKAINRMKKKLDLGPSDDVRKFFFEF